MAPRISIIIPSYNSEKTISRCLEALRHQSLPRSEYEIIVIDDGSLDNTQQILNSMPDIRAYFQNNDGPSSARNFGVKQSQGEIIVFTDSDCIPDPDWLDKLTAPLAQPEVAGSKGVYRTRQKGLIARFCQKEFEERYRHLSQYQYIDFVDSYSAAFRKDAFYSVGGFDTEFPLPNNEDVELSYKLASRGYKMVFVPDAAVYHAHPDQLSRYLKLKFSRAFWRMLVYKKYPGKSLKDTYTPFNLKIQLSLAFLFMLSLGVWGLQLFGIVSAIPLGKISLGILGALFLATIPLSWRIAKEDQAVGWVSPLILVGRALVFAVGTVAGIYSFFSFRFRFRYYAFFKRVFDMVVSLVILLLIAPIFVLLGVAICLDSPGPVIFRHKRMGRKGRYFTFYKFRTMIKDAESKKDELRRLSCTSGPVFKIKDDPRVTRVGKFLRRFSLDELPQLLNILNGTMSLVGPRPLPKIDIEHPELLHPREFKIDPVRLESWLRLRHSVSPGLTGLWQIRGRSDLPLEAWFNYDLEYVKRRSFWLDLHILLRTIPVVLLGKGAQ